MQKQLALFPQEKVCLHTDRTMFLAGDSVLMKAYVVDESTLVPVLNSQYVYVELLSDRGKLVDRKKLMASVNLFTGFMPLPADLEAGTYHLRAYTLYSAQVKGYECMVPIAVIDTGKPASASSAVQNSLPELRFFPEGGSLVSDATCMVAFEATDKSGMPAAVEGLIVNSHDSVVSRFRTLHHGLGLFPLAVEQGEHYKAVLTDEYGLQHSYRLPEGRSDVVMLSCRQTKEEVLVRVNRGEAFADRPMKLVVHCRGRLVSEQDVHLGTTYHLPHKLLPAGVNSVLLVDGDGHVLSERLLFSNRQDQRLPLTIGVTDTLYHARDSIGLQLSADNLAEGEFVFLSLSVTDDSITHQKHSPSFWSQLLLTSDVEGLVAAPDDYFEPAFNAQHADLLMLVNGWRRYDLPAVLKGQYAKPQRQHEQSQQFKGTVRKILVNRPVKNAEVLLLSKAQKFLATRSVDSLGVFEFDGVNLPEGTEVYMQAYRLDERRCSLTVAPVDYPEAPSSRLLRRFSRRQAPAEVADGLLGFYARNSHLLDEITVKGKKRTPQAHSIGGENSSRKVTREEIDRWGYVTFEQLLFDIPGLELDVAEHVVYSTIDRGATQLMGSQPLQLRVNDFYVPGLTYLDVDVEGIERVDVYAGVQAIPFGLTDGQWGGVLNVTLRNGSTMNRKPNEPYNRVVFTPLGYQEPVEYYWPRYPRGMSQTRVPDVRRTIYWNPYLRMVKATPLQLDFYSADLPTSYTVRVEGVTSRGRIADGQLRLRVEQ